MVVILYFNAVVGVIASAGRNTQRVRTCPIIVRKNRKPTSRAIQNLATKSEPAIEAPVGLPSIDDPGFNLQLLSGEHLDAHAGKKPRRVRRNVRRLVRPVIKVVKAEQAYVRQEDAGINVDPMQGIKVIASIGLVDIPVGI